jgi:dTDP-glucose pyrophosphorylase
MNVLILAAGKLIKGMKYPPCLTLFENKFLIEKVLEQISCIKNTNIIVTINAADNKDYHIDSSIKSLKDSIKLVYVSGSVKGAACSALLAVDLMNDEDLLILNSDEFIRYNFADAIKYFKGSNFDAGVIIFKSIHPKYSYVDINKMGHVLEAREKNPISSYATAGFYWFKSKKIFLKNTSQMIMKSNNYQNNFYICPVFNELILNGLVVGTIEIDSKDYISFKAD